jgi:selenocysteine lyase/cysteine desulfurase
MASTRELVGLRWTSCATASRFFVCAGAGPAVRARSSPDSYSFFLRAENEERPRARVFSLLVDLSGLRAEFPALSRLAYLNAGTDGPLPARAVGAAVAELTRELEQGRAHAHFERRGELTDELRSTYAAALGCDAADVALTTCTTEGIAQTIGGLSLDPGDEILTSDEEHPGLLGALAAARELRGASIREVPMSALADAVGPGTRLVACSHVGWMSGLVAPAELAEVDVPVLLDGAQGVGAIGVDVHALGCDAYAGAGQKWLCGPDGTGMLYLSPGLRERLAVPRRGYPNLADPEAGLEARLHEDARRFDSPALNAETVACALTATRLLESVGWGAVHGRARSLAERLSGLLAEQGREPAPRGDTTLVSFPSSDPPAERARLAERGVIVRNIPGRPWLRASVGAWNDEEDLDRLMSALSG